MREWKIEEMSLPALFEQGRKIHLTASELSVVQETVRNGCESLQQCEETVSKLGLFSANETKDDISTINLIYLWAFISELDMLIMVTFWYQVAYLRNNSEFGRQIIRPGFWRCIKRHIRTSSGETPAVCRLLTMQAMTPSPSERGSVR